jgi:hypothetical protein
MGLESSVKKNAIKKAGLVGPIIQAPSKSGCARLGIHGKITGAPTSLFSFQTILTLQ